MCTRPRARGSLQCPKLPCRLPLLSTRGHVCTEEDDSRANVCNLIMVLSSIVIPCSKIAGHEIIFE